MAFIAAGISLVLTREHLAEGRCLTPGCDANHNEPDSLNLLACPSCGKAVQVGWDNHHAELRVVCLGCGVGHAAIHLETRVAMCRRLGLVPAAAAAGPS